MKYTKSCRDINKFVATMILENLPKFVMALVSLSRQFNRDQRLNNKEDIVKTNLGDTR